MATLRNFFAAFVLHRFCMYIPLSAIILIFSSVSRCLCTWGEVAEHGILREEIKERKETMTIHEYCYFLIKYAASLIMVLVTSSKSNSQANPLEREFVDIADGILLISHFVAQYANILSIKRFKCANDDRFFFFFLNQVWRWRGSFTNVSRYRIAFCGKPT